MKCVFITPLLGVVVIDLHLASSHNADRKRETTVCLGEAEMQTSDKPGL